MERVRTMSARFVLTVNLYGTTTAETYHAWTAAWVALLNAAGDLRVSYPYGPETFNRYETASGGLHSTAQQMGTWTIKRVTR